MVSLESPHLPQMVRPLPRTSRLSQMVSLESHPRRSSPSLLNGLLRGAPIRPRCPPPALPPSRREAPVISSPPPPVSRLPTPASRLPTSRSPLHLPLPFFPPLASRLLLPTSNYYPSIPTTHVAPHHPSEMAPLAEPPSVSDGPFRVLSICHSWPTNTSAINQQH